MENVLIINGSEIRSHAKGELNQAFVDIAIEELSPHFEILQTKIRQGYDIKTEQDKFLNSSFVIFQYPMFWFGTPSILKKYIDDVYEHGIFFEHSDKYGYGGKLGGRKYMISATLNAPEDTFNSQDSFAFKDKTIEDVLIQLHAANAYIGLTQLPTFIAFNIFRTNIEEKFKEFRQHIRLCV